MGTLDRILHSSLYLHGVAAPFALLTDGDCWSNILGKQSDQAHWNEMRVNQDHVVSLSLSSSINSASPQHFPL